jgi:outer membrane assembly lipoprotein YfiO
VLPSLRKHLGEKAPYHGFAYILLALAVLVLSGCPHLFTADNPDKELSPDELFKKAEQAFEAKNYSESVDLYGRLKLVPDFKDMAKVYVRIGDAYFNDKAYEKAIGGYTQFLDLYPNDKEVPRVRYNMAMCLYNQIKRSDLDAVNIENSAKDFKKLADNPDAGEWGKKAQEKYTECRKMLAEKEYEKANTYISQSKYSSARKVLERIRDEFPNLGYDKQAESLLKSIKNK